MQQALLRMVLKRVQRAVAADNHCRELQGFYESLLLPMCEKVASKDLWLPELGFVLALCKSGRADTACAQLGLALFALVDEPAEWSVRFVQGAEILFAGSIIPVDGTLSARFERGRVQITTSESSQPLDLKYANAEKLWKRSDTADVPFYDPVLLGIGKIKLYVSGFKTGDEDTSQLPMMSCARAVSPEAIHKHAAVVSGAVSLIEDVGDDYANWVGRSIKLIQMLDTWKTIGDPVYTSCSWPSRPSIVSMGLSTAPTKFDYGFRVADALVHEASHQYANLVSLAFPLSNGTDSNLYYSQLAGRERPIDRVLFAFHAAGNIALFYADALLHGRSECEYNFKWAVDCANSLRQPLEKTSGLTDAGVGVFQPLAAALDQIDPSLLPNG